MFYRAVVKSDPLVSMLHSEYKWFQCVAIGNTTASYKHTEVGLCNKRH